MMSIVVSETCLAYKIAELMYLRHPSYTTHARSRTHFNSYLPTVYNTNVY